MSGFFVRFFRIIFYFFKEESVSGRVAKAIASAFNEDGVITRVFKFVSENHIDDLFRLFNPNSDLFDDYLDKLSQIISQIF